MNKLFSMILLGALMVLSQPLLANPGAQELLAADSSKIALLLEQIEQLDAAEDHCEVPCGIYGDSLRVALISEHIRTIEKASNQINKLSKESNPNYNQLIRWVVNKEK
ncbi:MAG: superoxide dismutase [Ni], partial [Bacteroidota bacterium]